MNSRQEYRIQYYLMELCRAQGINDAVWSQYREVRDDPGLRRTHYFAGRYENIYVGEDRMPALKPVLKLACEGASRFLQRSGVNLSFAFWLNEMGPGHVTLSHRHDEDDELAAGVYYVKVPENSGDLVLTQGVVTTRITPRPGMFVFFAPDHLHEVTENRSVETRLSIGMNFGVRKG